MSEEFTHEERFTLVYPERRVVSGTVIRTWYEDWYTDALEDGETDGYGAPETLTNYEMAVALHNIGLITLGKG